MRHTLHADRIGLLIVNLAVLSALGFGLALLLARG